VSDISAMREQVTFRSDDNDDDDDDARSELDQYAKLDFYSASLLKH
jgi:hypothetical protein